jgi:hypothetical protein
MTLDISTLIPADNGAHARRVIAVSGEHKGSVEAAAVEDPRAVATVRGIGE